MAFNVHWKIFFKSLRAGSDYCVNIYKDGSLPSGYPLTLKGGSQPFITEEDSDDDMFAPIRTQTGYIRIVDDGHAETSGGAATTWNWKELLPATDTDRPVVLQKKVGNSWTTVWQGFMQAQTFGGVLYGNPQEREFPVQCPLTVTQGTDINYQQTSIQNFAYLLKQIVDSIPSVSRPTDFVIQGGADAQAWLLKKIDWQNFVSEDGDGNLVARFSMYQCLEDMCRFWGWTARTCGTTMYLTMADDAAETTFLSLTTAQLDTLAAGTTAGSTSATFDTTSLTGDIFANTNQNDYLQRGPNKSIVTDNPTTFGNDLIEIFNSKSEKQMKDLGWDEQHSFYDGTTQFTNDLLSINLTNLQATAKSGYGAFAVSATYSGLVGAEKDNRYNAIRIKKTYDATADPSISIVTRYEHTFYNGFFRILGKIYQGQEHHQDPASDGYSGRSEIVMKLGIGHTRSTAKWWDGQQWVASETKFRGSTGGWKDEIFTVKWLGQTNRYDCSIIDSGNLSGYMFFEIFGTDSASIAEYDNERMFELKDFEIQFIKNDTVSKIQYPNSRWNDIEFLQLPNKLEYKASNNNNVRNDFNADCIYASEIQMEPAFGVILNQDNSYMRELNYGGGTPIRPEQHLANRVVNYWATSKRRLEVELRTNAVADITPKYKTTTDGTTGYPIAISRDWRDDITKLTILEL